MELGWQLDIFTGWKSLAVGKPFWKKCFPTPLPKTFSPLPAEATVYLLRFSMLPVSVALWDFTVNLYNRRPD